MRLVLVDYVKQEPEPSQKYKIVLGAVVLCTQSTVMKTLPQDSSLLNLDISSHKQKFIGLVDSFGDAKQKFPEYFL